MHRPDRGPGLEIHSTSTTKHLLRNFNFSLTLLAQTTTTVFENMNASPKLAAYGHSYQCVDGSDCEGITPTPSRAALPWRRLSCPCAMVATSATSTHLANTCTPTPSRTPPCRTWLSHVCSGNVRLCDSARGKQY